MPMKKASGTRLAHTDITSALKPRLHGALFFHDVMYAVAKILRFISYFMLLKVAESMYLNVKHFAAKHINGYSC